MVSSFAAKAAQTATLRLEQQQRLEHQYRTANIVSSSIIEDKENQQQLDKVVESVANATKRLSQLSTNTTNSSKRKSQNHVGPWRLGRTLGRGSTGRVRLLKHSVTGQLAAVKIVPKLTPESAAGNKKLKNNIKIDKNGLPYGIEREIIIMKVISHPNIMALYDVWENKNELYLVLEYIEGGELFDYLVRKGKLEEKEAVSYFKQIVSGLQYCHQFNICHRDLKPENLLLDKHRKIKIADFGMATLETQGNLLETSCGSPHYASPEIVAGKNYHGGPSDIWSAGIILFALLTGRLPFDDPNIRELLLKVQSGKFKMPANLSTEAKDLIWKMLKVDPRQRISIDEILNHPLIVKYYGNRSYNQQNNANQIDSLDMRPITQFNDEILKNLQTLWHDIDIGVLKTRLASSEKNSEKIFYQLLKTHLKSRQESKKSSDSRKQIPRSTSVVTTTITDANGETIKTITTQVPISSPPAASNSSRKPLGISNINTLNLTPKKTKTIDGKKPVMSLSMSYRKPKSFRAHKKSPSGMSGSSSKRSIRSPLPSNKNIKVALQQLNTSNISTVPEARESRLNVMDFMYLCDEIFGKEETVLNLVDYKSDIASKRELEKSNQLAVMKAELQRKQEHERKLAEDDALQARKLAEQQRQLKEELHQLELSKLRERDAFLATSARSHNSKPSLDPGLKFSGKPNAQQVLSKFGVRMSRFGNLRDFDSQKTLLTPPVISGLNRRSNLIESKSVSTRDLKSYLRDESKRSITVDEFNNKRNSKTSDQTSKTRSHRLKPSEDISFDFSINEVQQRMPISPVDKFTFNEPKMYSVSARESTSKTTTQSAVDDRYLDAETSMSSLEEDQDIIRIVNAISTIDLNQGMNDPFKSSRSGEKSMIISHRKADSRQEDDVSSTEMPASGSNIRNVKRNISRDDTDDLNTRFNLTPDKTQHKSRNLKSLIIDNELLLKNYEAKQKRDAENNKFLRLSIYEDPEDTTTIEDNIQEMDHESLVMRSISNDLVDMSHYDRRKSLMSKFVTRPLNESRESVMPRLILEDEDAVVNRRRSVKIRDFFNYNLESKESRKKFLKPIRQAPKLPSYKTYNFEEEMDTKKEQKKTKNNKAKSKKHDKTKNKGMRLLRRLLQHF